jgi:hypothetical protein
MPKPRKMLSDCDAPYIVSLMRLIETQSKATIADWCVSYAEAHLQPVWEKAFPDDGRPRAALQAARDWLEGKIKLPVAKKFILDAHAAAREAETNPAAQAAARAIGQAASSVHSATHSLGLPLYGSLAIAYGRLGVESPWEERLRLAAEECRKMEAALKAVAVEDEPNPAKVNWKC